MKNFLERNGEKGITLIALVITIIVLLILAAVTINLTLGERGIFRVAQQAAKNYTNAQNRELAKLDDLNYDITYVTTGSSEKEWNEEKGVNEPQIKGTNLKPIIIEDGTGDITKVGEQADNWYSYKTKTEGGLSTWANAVSEGSSKEYDSYWVWIPRFAYKLTKTSSGAPAGGEIEIVFLKGTTDNPASKTSEGNETTNITIKRASEVTESDTNVYIVHPAFTNESGNGYANGGWDREIPGFWIAKFEAGYVGEAGTLGTDAAKNSPVVYTTTKSWNGSTETETQNNYYGERSVDSTNVKWPTFQPFRPSFNYIGISDAYELCKAIDGSENNGQENPYKLSRVDSHLTKNSEWGAVAYLSYSDYGQGNATEVTINNRSAGGSNNVWAVTGYAGDTAKATTAEFNLADLTAGSVSNPWYSANGDNASTTGNTSGVYDMSGGLMEWTAGYIVPTVEGPYRIYHGKFEGSNTKYMSKYSNSDKGQFGPNNYNVDSNKKRLGEAIWETSSSGKDNTGWFNDNSDFLASDTPFMRRGGTYGNAASAGIFAFNRFGGYCDWLTGFRAVLVYE